MPIYRFEKLRHAFDTDHVSYWSNLSRINNLLVIMNISMFFLTGLVAKGYFFTSYSLICSVVVGMGVLVPTTLIHKLWYYWVFLVVELAGLYFSGGQRDILGSQRIGIALAACPVRSHTNMVNHAT